VMENAFNIPTISARRYRSLDVIDGMPSGLRESVHEFGLPIVSVLVKHGVKSPKAIREIVKEVWAGARQEGQRNDARSIVDWLLMQNGAHPPSVYRMLAENNHVLTTVEPTRAMVEASMAELANHNVRCTKYEKHCWRLRAALRAAMKVMVRRSDNA
jgi:hypothetical protein